jgi:phosphoribosylaminoimidazolecarboxamide formyltransferase/IMP cyclohydrolase
MEGVDSKPVEDQTGSPVLLGGRVKTLHPRIHAALLARRDDESHKAELAREGIEPIDLVAVNLYPYAKAAAAGKRGLELQEHIDIGGATLLRAAAKNYQDVVVIARPDRYNAVLDELKGRGNVSLETRRLLAAGGVLAHRGVRRDRSRHASWARPASNSPTT